MSAPSAVPFGLVVGDWLTYSETFIYDQVVHQKRTHAHVCARERIPGADERFPYPDVRTLGLAHLKAYNWFRYAPTFERFLRNAHARFVHAHFGTNGTQALNLVDRLGVPLAVTFHGHDVSALEAKNRFVRRYAYYRLSHRRLFERAGLLICASTDLAERLLSEHAAPEAKVIVHRLGIDLSRFQPVERDAGPLRMLMVGRMVEKKGMDYAVRAFAKVRLRRRDIRMTIVGDGPLRSSLQGLASGLGLSDAVEFTGPLPPSGVLAAMHRSHILLAPSVVAANGDRESGVLVIKEAAATGIPTIGTWHGGIPEIIDDEKTGYLVPERDVGALAERIERLVENDSLRKALGSAAIEKMAREYDTVEQNRVLEERLISML